MTGIVSGPVKNHFIFFLRYFFLIFCSSKHLANPTHSPTYLPLCWRNTWMVPWPTYLVRWFLVFDVWLQERWRICSFPYISLELQNTNPLPCNYKGKVALNNILLTHGLLFRTLDRADMGGKAAKAWSLAWFWEIENGSGSGSVQVKWPPLFRRCLPKIYLGGPAIELAVST